MTHKIIKFISTRPSVEILLEIKQRLLPRKHEPTYTEPSHHFVVVKMAGKQPVAYWRGSGHGTNERWTKRRDLAYQYMTEYQARRDTDACALDHKYNYQIQLVRSLLH
jgi:hypothetical protein